MATDARGRSFGVGDAVTIPATVLAVLPRAAGAGSDKLSVETEHPSGVSGQKVQLHIDSAQVELVGESHGSPTPGADAVAPESTSSADPFSDEAVAARAEAALKRGEDPADAEAKFIAESDLTPAEKKAAAKKLKDAQKGT